MTTLSENAGPLSLPNVRLLLSGQLLSQLGDKILSVGLVWFIALNSSEQTVAWYIAANSLPHLVLAPFTSRTVQQRGALRTVIFTDFARAFLFAVAAFLVFFWAKSDQNTKVILPLLFALGIGTNVFSSYFNPAVLTLPQLVAPLDMLGRVNGMISACFSVALVLGPLLALGMLHVLGLAGLLLLTGCGYLIAALCEMKMKIFGTDTADTESETYKLSALRSDYPSIFHILVLFLGMNFFFAPLFVFLPLFAKNRFAQNMSALVALEVAFGIGTIVGGLLLSVVRSSWLQEKRAPFYLAAAAVSYGVFSMATTLEVAAISLAALGLCVSVNNVLVLTFFQKQAKPQAVPAIMAMVNTISIATLPLAMFLLGFLLPHINISTVASVCACVVFGLALMLFRVREMRFAKDVG